MRQLPKPTPMGTEAGDEAGGGARPSPDLPTVSRSDARLYQRAIAGRWPMSREMRELVMQTLYTIVANPGRFEPRVVIRAAATLMEADRLNMKDEERSAKQPIVQLENNGDPVVDFTHMTDADIDQYIAAQRVRG